MTGDNLFENQSEVEDTVRIKHIADVNPKKSEISLSKTTEVSFVPLDAIGTQGDIKYTETRQLGEVYDGYTYFKEGDIVLAKITPSFENGKGAICEELLNDVGFGTTEIHVLRPHKKTDTAFLWYLLRSKPFIGEAIAAMHGVAGQKRVPSSFVENYEVPYLPYQTQRRISSYINDKITKIDKIVKDTEKLEQKLEEQRLSLIWESVTSLSTSENSKSTNIPWLGEIPESWDVAKIGWYYDIQLGKMLDESEISGEHLAPYLRNTDVQWWDINTKYLPKMDFTDQEREKYQLRQGDVLVCEGGEAGRSAVWRGSSEEIYYQKALHRVRPIDNEQIPEFFCYFMEFAVKTGLFSSRSNQSTIEHVTVEKLSGQKMPIPPKKEQKRISRALSDSTKEIDDALARVRELREVLKEKREALITAAVTGQIDVSEERGVIQGDD